jgi:hypothetical protein
MGKLIYELHVFFNVALNGAVTFKPDHFITKVRASHTPWIEGWLDPSSILDMMWNKISPSILNSSVALIVA